MSRCQSNGAKPKAFCQSTHCPPHSRPINLHTRYCSSLLYLHRHLYNPLSSSLHIACPLIFIITLISLMSSCPLPFHTMHITNSCIYPFYHPTTPTFSHHFPHPSYLLTSITTYPLPNTPSIPPHRLSTFSGHPFPIFHNTRTHIPILRGAFPRLIPKVNSCNHGKSLQGS